MENNFLIYIENKEKEYFGSVKDDETWNSIERYKPFYKDVPVKGLKNLFAYFHSELNSLFRELNSGRNRINADPSRYYLKLIEQFLTIEENLQKSKYEFNIESTYKNKILECNKLLEQSNGTDIPNDFQRIAIIEVRPIFELLNTNAGLKLFQDLIAKLYDKNWDLGKTFESKVRYKSFQDNLLTWETMVSDDEKILLKNNWKHIREFVQTTFGRDTKIENIPVENLNINENKKLNQTNFSIKTGDSIPMNKIEDRKLLFSNKDIEYDFKYNNILLKGVPGTGKSRMIDKIINHHLKLENQQETNVLRINIHSASSNADLMQGIGISSNEKGEIEYKERQGLIFELIERATFNPNQPFALVLEEIQENSLNELIGDLIYLIEDSKRANNLKPDNKEYTYKELLEKVLKDSPSLDKVKMPNLISQDSESKVMLMPDNLFVFCTSNYRDDRKVIEDNLLRRFEVIEIYPKYKEDIGDDFKSEDVSTFLKALNESIISVCKGNGEIHPDRFMIGHSIWLKVDTKEEFSRAFLKVVTEFKDVRDMHFDDFQKIMKDLEFPFEVEKEYTSYEEWIKVLQNECYDFLNLK